MRYLYALVVASILACLAAPVPAAALDCVAPEETLDRMDVIVRGMVVAIEEPGWFVKAKRRQIQIDVAKYYKGSGYRSLTGYLGGVGDDNTSWMNSADVGDEVVVAFRYEGLSVESRVLVNRPCNLMMELSGDGFMPEPVASRLGPGTDPLPGGPASVGRSFPWGWGALVFTLVAGGLVIWQVRRRRAG